MGDKPGLLFHSNAPWTQTGYGQQCGIFTPRLAKHYHLAISSFWGLDGGPIGFGGIPVLPCTEGHYGNDSLPLHADALWGDRRNGTVLTLMDVWVLDPGVIRQMNVCSWVPVDHQPAPPMVRTYFQESGAIPIAMSRFGQEQLADFDPLYVPHGIETKVYCPKDRAEAREQTGMPKDAFVVGMVAANKGNPSRKCFAEAFQAFAELHKKHSDAALYVHSELTGKYDGVNLRNLMDATGVPRSAVYFADQYRVQLNPWNSGQMASIYSMMDVLLAASAGEGFGIPVLEANACGVPAIVTDFSAQPEVNGAGWSVGYSDVYTPQMSWQAKPNVGEMVEALEAAYSLPTSVRAGMGKQAREHALDYDADKVIEDHFLPALEAVQERVDELAPQQLVAA